MFTLNIPLFKPARNEWSKNVTLFDSSSKPFCSFVLPPRREFRKWTTRSWRVRDAGKFDGPRENCTVWWSSTVQYLPVLMYRDFTLSRHVIYFSHERQLREPFAFLGTFSYIIANSSRSLYPYVHETNRAISVRSWRVTAFWTGRWRRATHHNSTFSFALRHETGRPVVNAAGTREFDLTARGRRASAVFPRRPEYDAVGFGRWRLVTRRYRYLSQLQVSGEYDFTNHLRNRRSTGFSYAHMWARDPETEPRTENNVGRPAVTWPTGVSPISLRVGPANERRRRNAIGVDQWPRVHYRAARLVINRRRLGNLVARYTSNTPPSFVFRWNTNARLVGQSARVPSVPRPPPQSFFGPARITVVTSFPSHSGVRVCQYTTSWRRRRDPNAL